MFEYQIEENTDDKLVSVYKVKESVRSFHSVALSKVSDWPMIWGRHRVSINLKTDIFFQNRKKMHSWIGPDHADQSQIHQIIKTDDSETHHVTVKTKNYPYSETFNVLQVWVLIITCMWSLTIFKVPSHMVPPLNCKLSWEFKRLSDTQLHVKMSSGIDWIDPPMSIIRSNIESSITKGQKANAQQFSRYFTK